MNARKAKELRHAVRPFVQQEKDRSVYALDDEATRMLEKTYERKLKKAHKRQKSGL